jgi:hypothetical protein
VDLGIDIYDRAAHKAVVHLGSGGPTVGDLYSFEYAHYDGPQTVSAQVTGVLTTPIAASPTGSTTSSSPTFTWSLTGTAPSGAVQYVELRNQSGALMGSAGPLPSSQTSLSFSALNGPPGLAPSTYFWTVSIVDADGNRGVREQMFVVTP